MVQEVTSSILHSVSQQLDSLFVNPAIKGYLFHESGKDKAVERGIGSAYAVPKI